MKDIRINRITDVQAFQKLEHDWNDVLSTSRSDTIFLTYEWINAWISNYLRDDNLYVLAVYENKTVVAIAPFYISSRKTLLTNFKVIKLIGDYGVGSWYLDFLIREGYEDLITKQIFHYLRENKEDYDLLSFRGISNHSPNLEYIKLQGKETFKLLSESRVCSRVQLPQNWEEYLRRFNRNHKRGIKAKRKKLASNFKVSFYISDLEKDMDKYLKTLFNLHQKRWVKDGFPGSFSDINKRTFYHDFAKASIQRKWVRLYCLEIDNEIKAMQFGLFYNKRLHNLQEGYDPEWKKYGPGNVLRGYIIEQIINEGVDVYDFLHGTSYHKKNWKAVESHAQTLIMHNRRNIKSQFFMLVYMLKKWYKKRTPDYIIKKYRLLKGYIRSKKVTKKTASYTNIEPLFKNISHSPN